MRVISKISYWALTERIFFMCPTYIPTLLLNPQMPTNLINMASEINRLLNTERFISKKPLINLPQISSLFSTKYMNLMLSSYQYYVVVCAYAQWHIPIVIQGHLNLLITYVSLKECAS
ncbi:hypothetical protein AMECASPLE_024992 [Ameca splendens]|uniref:Uncharacterized protein n=1 Tax=Ameca splendens TaxID=208324 RepID=A0ABV0YSR2_9TELE